MVNKFMKLTKAIPDITVGTEALNITNAVDSASQDVSTQVTTAGPEWMDYYTHTPKYPYCPVFLSPTEKGKEYVVYLIGGIVNVSEYTNVIGTLSNMTESDTCKIYIDSPGGDLLTGASISSAIVNCKGHVTTIAVGICASAGSLIWDAGHTQEVSDFATLMYHMSSHFDGGNSVRIADNATVLKEYVTTKCLSVAKDKRHITDEEFDNIVNNYGEAWISSAVMKTRMTSDTVGTEVLDISGVTVGYDGNPQLQEVSDLSVALENLESENTLKNKLFYSALDLNKLKFSDAYEVIKNQTLNPSLGCMDDQRQDPRCMFTIVKLSDHNYMTILDYFKDLWSPKFVTAFSKTLDKLTEEDTIEIVLPGGLALWSVVNAGAMLSAMLRCKGKIKTSLYGLCNFMDMVFWIYGNERTIGQYGNLVISAEIMDNEQFIKYRGPYLDTILTRAVAIDLITEDQKKAFFSKKQNIKCAI